MKILFSLLPLLFLVPFFINEDFVNYMRVRARFYEKLVYILGFFIFEWLMLFGVTCTFIAVGFIWGTVQSLLIYMAALYMIGTLLYVILVVFFVFGNKLRTTIHVGWLFLMFIQFSLILFLYI